MSFNRTALLLLWLLATGDGTPVQILENLVNKIPPINFHNNFNSFDFIGCVVVKTYNCIVVSLNRSKSRSENLIQKLKINK